MHDPDAMYDPIRRMDVERFPESISPYMQTLLSRTTVTEDMIKWSGLPVDRTVFLTIGGGIGSFIWINNLLIYGARPAHVLSIGMERKPYGRYRRLCRQSQIPIVSACAVTPAPRRITSGAIRATPSVRQCAIHSACARTEPLITCRKFSENPSSTRYTPLSPGTCMTV